jgi:hypothetical protein
MMAPLRIDFQGRRKGETCPRARVQPMGDGIQLALRVARQVRAPGQVLAQQAIGGFVGAALPWAIRIGKEHPDCEPRGQALMLGHLFPSIVGQGFAQGRGHMSEFLGEALSRTSRIRPVHPGQNDQTCGPFDQGPDGRAIASPLDQIAFPVAGHRTGGHLGGTLGERRHIGDLPASIGPSRPRATRLAGLPQRGQQFAAQGTAGQHIQRRIDGLGRKLFGHVVRIRAAEAPGNLFRRTAVFEVGLDILPQPGIQEFARSPWLTGSGDRLSLRRADAIGVAPRRVAGAFPAEGAGGAAQYPGHHPERMALGEAQAQSRSLFRTQMRITGRVHDNTLAHPGRQCCTWS